MSLLDALLLDPYRINVWIAYRMDGVKGSGTQADPWDGSTDSNSVGIYLWKCESAITEQNLIDPAVGTTILQYSSGVLEYFGNSTPVGVLLQGYDQQ
jgi:hypothetical protein